MGPRCPSRPSSCGCCKGLYEDALDHLLAHDENLVQTAIDSTFGRSDFTLAGPVTPLTQLFRTGIITTNFDGVIEEAFAAVRRTIVVRQGNRPQDIIRLLKEGDTCLLKLHGQGSSRTDRILSGKEYDAHYGPRGAVDMAFSLPRVLSHVFQNMTLFFMGCSLVSDRTMEVFKATMKGESRDGETLPRHYALLADPGSSKRAGRRSELSEYNIFPIFYRCKEPEDHSAAVNAVLTSILAHLEG